MNVGTTIISIGVIFFGIAIFPAVRTWHENRNHDFYFSCKEKGKDEYIVKLNDRPRQDGSMYILDDDIIYIQKPDTYCRVLRDDQVKIEPLDK